MSGTHGDLFSEIGGIVMAAHADHAIDLPAVSEELAARYANLGIPAETIRRAIARSLGAVGFSLALADASAERAGGGIVVRFAHSSQEPEAVTADVEAADQAKAAAGLFPSGVRLAVL
jgi:hypothetical protein